MTKLRPAVSIEQALYKVLGELGPDRASEVTGRAPGYLTSLSDQDTRFQLSVRDAIALDIAYRGERAADAAGSYPIFEAYGLLLDCVGSERFATAEALHRHAVEVVKEGGDAGAALIRASLPNATPSDREAALRELEQSIAADKAAIRLLSGQRTQGGPAP